MKVQIKPSNEKEGHDRKRSDADHKREQKRKADKGGDKKMTYVE